MKRVKIPSGVHFSGIFSKLSGLSMLKHIKITSVSRWEKNKRLEFVL